MSTKILSILMTCAMLCGLLKTAPRAEEPEVPMLTLGVSLVKEYSDASQGMRAPRKRIETQRQQVR